MTGRSKVTIKEIEDIKHHVEEMHKGNSWIQKVRGIFSFVNMIWAISIIGLCVTVLPCLLVAIGPAIGRAVAELVKLTIELLKTIT